MFGVSSTPIMKNLLILLFTGAATWLTAQTGTITGLVSDAKTNETLVGAIVRLEGTDFASDTDLDGRFVIAGIPPRTYNLIISYVGYETLTRFNVPVTTGNVQTFNIALRPGGATLGEVEIVISRSTRVASTETPLSIQSLTVEEIRSNPGGNFDISRVLQALPGVSGATGGGGARNDLIIRGGGPSENVFYLDGVEIPVLNHFQTQGAAGGPAGIINVSFIEDAILSTSAFNARYDNALSAVLQFKQREGNRQRLQGNFRVSASETALTLDGPIGQKSSFIASARRSYLQFLFQLLDLPIRPDYWDFQYKVTRQLDDRTTLDVIGIGAIDYFSLAPTSDASPENIYIVGSVPFINQWNYTQGFSLRRLTDNGYYNVVLSRNMFNNQLQRFRDNWDGQQRDPDKRTLFFNSQEIENKLRLDNNKFYGGWKVSYGAGVQYARYLADTRAEVKPGVVDSAGNTIQPAVTFAYNTGIDLFKFGAFGQVNRTLLNDRLGISAGLRFDGNTFTTTGAEVWRTLSPRVSAAYAFAPGWKASASVGRYFKLAPYTVLGFQNEGNFVNRDVEYLRTDHAVVGVEYLPSPTSRITAEAFYKWYGDYPVSDLSGVSLANLGTDFGILGNEPVSSIGNGRAYGFELFFQQKLAKKVFATVSYTYFISQFSGTDGRLVRSSWDNRHLVSTIFGYKLPRNWELGLKYRLQGSAPYTPFDLEASRINYALTGQGVLNFDRLNSEELRPFSQFDIRIDKKWNFRKFSLDAFIDVTNALVQQTQGLPNYTFRRLADNSGWDTTDGNELQPDGSNAQPIILDNLSGNLLPTIGLIIEF